MFRYNYKKEERFEIRYISKKDGTEKVCCPRSKEKKDEQLAIAKEQGVQILSVKKLYPFSTNRNQHNFELVKNKCFNRMDDMRNGDIPFDKAEYDRLAELADRAGLFCCYELPVAWVTWEEHKEMKQLAAMAVNSRIERCEEIGRPDLIQYCH